ncbi:MAG: hypothetical protein AAB487_02755 [Patescibacteria group bacterium]
MKKLLVGASLAVFAFALSVSFAFAAKPTACATIKDGTITDSAGNPISSGYDQFGYNYQAHMFNGTYDSSDRTLDGTYWGDTGDYVDDKLMMKWSDPWLANVDCDNNGKLDRGLVDGVIGGTSVGWLTNQINGDYDSDGNGTQDAHYTWFDKIIWVGPGGSLWGEYEIIQEVVNDPADGLHGLQFKIGAPGFGLNDQWTTN